VLTAELEGAPVSYFVQKSICHPYRVPHTWLYEHEQTPYQQQGCRARVPAGRPKMAGWPPRLTADADDTASVCSECLTLIKATATFFASVFVHKWSRRTAHLSRVKGSDSPRLSSELNLQERSKQNPRRACQPGRSFQVCTRHNPWGTGLCRLKARLTTLWCAQGAGGTRTTQALP